MSSSKLRKNIPWTVALVITVLYLLPLAWGWRSAR